MLESDIDSLRVFFESLIPSGEYFITESSGISIRTRTAVDSCRLPAIIKFIKEKIA